MKVKSVGRKPTPFLQNFAVTQNSVQHLRNEQNTNHRRRIWCTESTFKRLWSHTLSVLTNTVFDNYLLYVASFFFRQTELKQCKDA